MNGQNAPIHSDLINNLSLDSLMEKSYQIVLYAEKLKADRDSLIVELDKRTYYIENARAIIENKSDAFDLLSENYSSLQKELDRLSRRKRLKGLIGGGVESSFTNLKQFDSMSFHLNAGILLNQRHLSIIDVGIGLGNKVLIGVRQSIIF